MSLIALRTYRPGDERGIRTLFEQVFGKPLSHEQWLWKYRLSLRARALPMLAVQDTGEIVGHAGALYLKGIRDDREIPFLQICDVMVHSRARGHLGDKNLYTRMIRQYFDRLAADFPGAFAYGFPGTRPFKLGRYAGVYESIERAREITVEARKPSPWLTIEPAPIVAPRLNRVWKRLRGHFPLAVVRDSKYLAWRYRDHPAADYRRIDLFSWGRHVGWVLYRSLAEKNLIVDILCQPWRLERYLSAVAHWLGSRNESPAVVWLPGRLTDGITGTSEETGVVTTNMTRGFQTSTAEAREQLYYTMGDLDIF
jgi:hypothetical protein